MSSRRLPAFRDLVDDLRPDPLSSLPAVYGTLPDVRRAPTVDVHHRPIPPAPRPLTSTAAILDDLFQHSTTLGAPDPAVVEWLGRNRVPISPAGTVLLMKGVRSDFRSKHGALYLPGHMVIDPDFGARENAGVYLCPSRENAAAFMQFEFRWRLIVVEAAVSDLTLYQRDFRKITARQVYVHREIPR
jgi:hypothetical protein